VEDYFEIIATYRKNEVGKEETEEVLGLRACKISDFPNLNASEFSEKGLGQAWCLEEREENLILRGDEASKKRSLVTMSVIPCSGKTRCKPKVEVLKARNWLQADLFYSDASFSADNRTHPVSYSLRSKRFSFTSVFNSQSRVALSQSVFHFQPSFLETSLESHSALNFDFVNEFLSPSQEQLLKITFQEDPTIRTYLIAKPSLWRFLAILGGLIQSTYIFIFILTFLYQKFHFHTLLISKLFFYSSILKRKEFKVTPFDNLTETNMLGELYASKFLRLQD